MKKNLLFRLVALALALVLTVGVFSGCSQQKTLMELDGQKFSANMFELLLSRTKGNLESMGYNVKSSSFWDTVVELESGITFGEYYKQIVLHNAKLYLAAAVMFDEEGLTLPQSTYDSIDQDIEDYIVGDADGSKSQFNSMLSAYGVNVDILRELYVMEAKYEYLREYTYGNDGSKIAANVKQTYLDEYAVAFKHILIRSFYYEYQTDENGDEIYFLPNDNNEKVNNIAYDVKNGTTKLDEFGKIILDKNDSPIYYTADGKIAYDKENGVRALKYDEGGYPISKKYSTEQLAENKALANEILASVEKDDFAMFESYIDEYEAAGLDQVITDNEMCFVYTTGDNSEDVFNDLADELAGVDDGTVLMYPSDYGYHVMIKYKMPTDAASNEEYSQQLDDLPERVADYLYNNKCTEKAKSITVDDEVFAESLSMKEVGINKYY
ncbi:MAG: hypothetical protein IJX74_02100 [Clostridia bacterium]|nr:hypothetical protein [Clostridia bacterium]